MRETTAEKIRIICEIVNRHYEAGNQRRCYAAVWRQYVRRSLPMSYVTFSRLLRRGKEMGLLN
jgi:hypothetical protein